MRILTIFLMICLFGLPLGAEEKSLHDLLSQPTRPTMAQIQEYHPMIHKMMVREDRYIPIQMHRGLGIPYWANVLLRYTPNIIVALERTFPGGTWAFLGRDTQAIADVVEAYYLKHGQSHRVVRLGMSSATLEKATDEDLWRFLETHGFSFERARENPFIIVDTLSRGYGRQGRNLLATVYDRFFLFPRAEERDSAELLKQVNLFGLLVSTFQGEPHSYLRAGEYFQQWSEPLRDPKNWAKGRRFFLEPIDPFAKNKLEFPLLTFSQQPQFANEAGYEHFTLAWHAAYGSLERYPDGRVLASRDLDLDPNSPNVKDGIDAIRRSILWLQASLLTGVEDPLFDARVRWAGVQNEVPELASQMTEADLRTLAIATDHALRLERDSINESHRTWLQNFDQPRYPPQVFAFKRTSLSRNGQAINAMLTYHLSSQAQIPGTAPPLSSDAIALFGFQVLRDAVRHSWLTINDVEAILNTILFSATPSFQLAREFMNFAHQSEWFSNSIRSGFQDLEVHPTTKQVLLSLLKTAELPESCEGLL